MEKTRSFEYDKNGNRTQVRDRNSRITEYIYDDLNRQTHERWLDENDQVVNEIVTAYDAEGKLESATEVIEGVEGATTSYDYDERR